MNAEDFANYQNLIQSTTDANNAWSAKQAQEQMSFQERMSNTAHQREMADLKAAGLNPILAANSNGASTPTGAMADADRGNTTALFGLLEKMIDTDNAKANAEMSLASRAYTAGTYSVASPDITGRDIKYAAKNLGLNLSWPTVNTAAKVVNAVGNMNVLDVSRTLDNSSKKVAQALGSKVPPAGSSAAKAKVYRERTGNSSTQVGLSVIQKAVNRVRSLFSK